MAFNLINPAAVKASGLAAQLAQQQNPGAEYTRQAQIDGQRRLAEMLAANASKPVDSGLGAASAIAQALAGRFAEKRAEKAEAQNADYRSNALALALAQKDPSSSAAMLSGSADPGLQELGMRRTFGLQDETRQSERADQTYARQLQDARTDRQADREFTASQAAKAREFQGSQADIDRAHDVRIAGIKSGVSNVPPALAGYGNGLPAPENPQGKPASPQATLWDQVPEAVGVINSVQDISNKVLPQFVPGTFDEGTSAARADFRLIDRDLVKAFSINTRYPVAEQKRIQSLVPQASAFESVPNARAALIQIDKALQQAIIDDVTLLNSGAVPAKDATEILSRAIMMDQLRDKIGAPQGGAAQPAGQSGAGSVPPQAVQLLKSDPSPEAIAEFDEVFGPGAAQRVLNQ